MWLPQGMKKERMTWNHSGCMIFSRLAWKSWLTTPALKLSSQSPGAAPSVPSGPCTETQLPEWSQKQRLQELQFGYGKLKQSLARCKRKWQCEECGDQEFNSGVCMLLYLPAPHFFISEVLLWGCDYWRLSQLLWAGSLGQEDGEGWPGVLSARVCSLEDVYLFRNTTSLLAASLGGFCVLLVVLKFPSAWSPFREKFKYTCIRKILISMYKISLC